jgi:hypothetical protein
MADKFNPFNPVGMITAGMFQGRGPEIRTITRCVQQAKNGNPQHFLIQGERGIGKSSLFFLVTIMSDGGLTLLDSSMPNFLVVSADIGRASTQLDILRTLAGELKQAIDERAELQKNAKEFWDWLTNWEILGVRYHKHPDEYDAQQAAAEFVSRVAKFCKEIKDRDGILLLIDEADRPPEAAGLGDLVKFITERLARRQCNNFLIGMAGLPGVISKLRGSHESAPRIFHTMKLEPLGLADRKKVIREGLKLAKSKNGFETKIEAEALEMISELSEGYPHFVQQFAFSSFEADDNNVIDVADVKAGTKDALRQLGDKYFSEMYHARVASADYRKVLDAMAQHGDDWVQRADIIGESKVKPTSVTNALAALKKKEVIVQDESRQGFYRLPTKSFAAWINAIKATQSKSRTGDLF